MKNKILKILFVLIILLVSRQIQAQSYQRWITWSTPGHQLTAQEMGEITEKLYDKEISPGKVFSLSNGVSLKIPQPNLYLRFIRISVMSVRPLAKSKEDILDAINSADRFMWGNDVNVRVKNNWVSIQNKEATFTNNYSGEGTNSFFLFIDGIPTFKCDCGNPLELMEKYYSYRHENKDNKEAVVENDKVEAEPIKKTKTVVSEDEKESVSGFPKDLGALRQDFTKKTPESLNKELFPKEGEKKFFQKKGVQIAAYTLGALALGTAGYLIIDNLPKKTSPPVVGEPTDPTGPMDGKSFPIKPVVGIRIPINFGR